MSQAGIDVFSPVGWEERLRDSYETDPPLFNWQRMLPRAETIIERVAQPWKRPPARDVRPDRPGTDLSAFREDIAQLLAEIHEVHLIDLDDYQARNGRDPDFRKPERWGDKRSQTARRAAPAHEPDQLMEQYSGLGYGDDPGKLWDEMFARKRGNPGHSQVGGPPLRPVHRTYSIVQAWWRGHNLDGFTPNYAHGDDEAQHNAESRFLLAVLQSLDVDYTPAHARGLYETMRKQERREKLNTPRK